jgi:hypothetical protein
VPCAAPQQAAFSDGSQQTSCASIAQHPEVPRPESSPRCFRAAIEPSVVVIFVIVVSLMRRIARRYR